MIIGIILASGYSRRMKQNKLLLEVNGKVMIERIIQVSKSANLDDVILVYRNDKVKKIGKKFGIKTIYNSNAHLGQSTSLKLGVSEAKDAEAYMFIMGDQPFINKELINNLINVYRKNQFSIVVPNYNGRNGTPTIFPSRFRKELLKIEGDKGGREIIKNIASAVVRVSIDNELLGLDINTPNDLNSIKYL
ncbi:MAG: nucleotidyltransferase family protein [Firmicutes bacterium]|nr:nucleotidyltransferase family protein [Bacillota bacterium]